MCLSLFFFRQTSLLLQTYFSPFLRRPCVAQLAVKYGFFHGEGRVENFRGRVTYRSHDRRENKRGKEKKEEEDDSFLFSWIWQMEDVSKVLYLYAAVPLLLLVGNFGEICNYSDVGASGREER